MTDHASRTGPVYSAYSYASPSASPTSSTSALSSSSASYACTSPPNLAPQNDLQLTPRPPTNSVSALILIFIEIPLLLRICPTSAKFDALIRRVTTNYMRAAVYGVMSLIQWLSLIPKATSLVAAAVVLLIAACFYLLAGIKGQGFVGSKTLGGQGVAQMIV